MRRAFMVDGPGQSEVFDVYGGGLRGEKTLTRPPGVDVRRATVSHDF